MNIGFVGLGKLGLPCALAIESKEHVVKGCDNNPDVKKYIECREIPYKEEGIQEFLNQTKIEVISLQETLAFADIIFVAVQTPHEPLYEGVTPLPDMRKDFDYTYLKDAAAQLEEANKILQKKIPIVIISTVLPGTVYREILPLCPSLSVCYNPFFIAMGTTIKDFLFPEFVLLGGTNKEVMNVVRDFYSTITTAIVYKTSIINAELIKVSYNTFITMKISFANTLMQICDIVGANVDEVTKGLGLANRRLISTAYLNGGMEDGGGCHPRDNIALSWLAQDLGLTYDFFGTLMEGREARTQWLANIILSYSIAWNLPLIILGKSFKPETNIVTGSPSILLFNLLNNFYNVDCKMYDPIVDTYSVLDTRKPAIYFIGTKHHEFTTYKFAKGSVVIDPWGYMPEQEGVTIRRLGRREERVL